MRSLSPSQLDKLADFQANLALAIFLGFVINPLLVDGSLTILKTVFLFCATLLLLSSLLFAKHHDTYE
ncbi:MAG: hypothetical protein WBO77_02765 [Microgenomates group bacterium]